MESDKAIAILRAHAGETLRVLYTDPGSVKDFEAFCRATGDELVESTEDDGVFGFLIRKAA